MNHSDNNSNEENGVTSEQQPASAAVSSSSSEPAPDQAPATASGRRVRAAPRKWGGTSSSKLANSTAPSTETEQPPKITTKPTILHHPPTSATATPIKSSSHASSTIVTPTRTVVKPIRPIQQPQQLPRSIEVEEEDGSEEDAGTSDEESDEDDSNSIRPVRPTFKPICPFPLLFCLTVVGCTFLIASLLLLFGVRSWGVREAAVSQYNRAVEQWSHSYSQMKLGGFDVVDLVRHPEERGYQNETALLPITDNTISLTSSVLTSSGSTVTPSLSNDNGLSDRGEDVKTYSPLYYEVLIPSPISWDSSNNVDRYWSNLLSHDSRTLYIQSKYDKSNNSLFNLTIPFIKKEIKQHLTKHNCESSMSGMFDHDTKTCTFFSQLHSICLRVKLLELQPPSPTSTSLLPTLSSSSRRRIHSTQSTGASGPTQKIWSLDPEEVGYELNRIGPPTDEDLLQKSNQLLTAILVPPPVTHPSADAANVNITHSVLEKMSGCIWDASLEDWSIGEYHAVDIRSEHLIERDGPDALQPNDDDDDETRAMKHRLLVENMLRITIRHSSDPFLIAMALTQNTLWFGLAKTEKILLSVVLGTLGLLFLIAPTMTLAQFLSARTQLHFSRSKRARKGGYASVTRIVTHHDAIPTSPSIDTLIEMTPTKQMNGRSRHSTEGDLVSPSRENDPPTTGFVPSEALRRSLVTANEVEDEQIVPSAANAVSGTSSTSSSSSSSPEPSTISNGTAPPKSASSKRSTRIRIDPVPQYPEPIHQPPTPTRQPQTTVLIRREGDLPPMAIIKKKASTKRKDKSTPTPTPSTLATVASSPTALFGTSFNLGELFSGWSQQASPPHTDAIPTTISPPKRPTYVIDDDETDFKADEESKGPDHFQTVSTLV